KTFKIIDDRRHLGLLQHDFRNPDPIGAAWMLPRQVMAAILVEPSQQWRRDLARRLLFMCAGGYHLIAEQFRQSFLQLFVQFVSVLIVCIVLVAGLVAIVLVLALQL